MTTSEEQFHEELVAMVSQGQRDDGSATRLQQTAEHRRCRKHKRHRKTMNDHERP